jgi:hypothetical protein
VVNPFSILKIFLLSPPTRDGVLQSISAVLCSPTSVINTFDTTQHPAPMDAATLSLALEQHSAAQTAQQLAVSRYTIYRWCKILSISPRLRLSKPTIPNDYFVVWKMPASCRRKLLGNSGYHVGAGTESLALRITPRANSPRE